MRVLHLITDLMTGGAEMMLYKLVSRFDRDRFETSIVSLRGRGTLGARIEAEGVPVRPMGMSDAGSGTAGLVRLLGEVRRFRPDIIQGWMPHGNLFAALAGTAAPRARVLWNVRCSIDDLAKEKAVTRVVIRAGALGTARVRRIIYNSRAAAEQHEALGYPASKRCLLPNGFDCDRFRPSPETRRAVRAELGLAESDVVIGMVARFHPMKGHETFFRAAGALAARHPSLRFVLAGRGVVPGDPALAAFIRDNALEGRVRLLGEREDTFRIYPALDIVALASLWGEGFPNVVGEAMACGVPCVVTDVGDSAWVVGGHGLVVPPDTPDALAAGWATLIEAGSEGRARLGALARERVVEHFSLQRVVAQYEDLYHSLAPGPRPGRRPVTAASR
ncbi:MAG TPA: glycosyltransferase [Longimicrobium sp.]|jgi:glycosyltransferase involved in cell wall biosynthesis|nr:glycosyltransferase [Longimicrobium sp.]